MLANKHSNLDVLKLDIEGAALVVLNDMLDNDIFPSQIVAEFERPNTKKASDYISFYCDLNKLIDRLNSLGYSTHRLPREKYCYY